MLILLSILLIIAVTVLVLLTRKEEKYRLKNLNKDDINKINILMIGNSFILKNNMHKILQEMLGSQYSVDVIAKPAYSLKRHLQNPQLEQALKNKKYQYVVMQEKSSIPIKFPERLSKNFGDMIKYISQYQQAWIPVIYETYGRCYISDPNPLLTQTMIDDAYENVSEEYNAKLAKVGEAFLKFRVMDKFEVTDSILFNCKRKYVIHPTQMGSILTAMVFYRLFTDNLIQGQGPDKILEVFREIVNNM